MVSIGTAAFADCDKLAKIELGGTKVIGQDAFYACEGITSIKIPDTVETISEGAFYNCINLETLEMGANVKIIGKGAFYKCKALTSVTLPDTLKKIEQEAFYNCVSLESIVIPTSVKSIGQYAFYCCDNLTSASIGSSVKEIAANAFGGCGKVSFICNKDSAAHKYAIDNKIPYELNVVNQYFREHTVDNISVDEASATLYLGAGCKDVEDIIVIADNYTISTEKSMNTYCGTSSVISVLDENNVIVKDYTLVVEGDVNGDGVCDVLDCMLVELTNSGNTTLENAYLTAGDFDGDTNITINDFQQVVNKAKAE